MTSVELVSKPEYFEIFINVFLNSCTWSSVLKCSNIGRICDFINTCNFLSNSTLRAQDEKPVLLYIVTSFPYLIAFFSFISFILGGEYRSYLQNY
jgi:hypothetical protein